MVKMDDKGILMISSVFFALGTVIFTMSTMPGSFGNSTKYVKKDDTSSELKLNDISIPLILSSGTILSILFLAVMIYMTLNDNKKK
jgi:hypothetical protein